MMLDEHNVLVKSFRMVRDTIRQHGSSNLKFRLIARREGNGRMYNLPTIAEVAALVVGDFETSPADRDIIVETQTEELKWINELNASYLGPQLPFGGARYMIQNYQYAMAICKWAGYPELFITLTCSPKWPEVVRFVESRGLKPEDRLDILCRIFKVKQDQLVKDLRQNKIFGKVKAREDIDKIISVEIPDEANDPEYYVVIKNLMMHGPCGSLRKNSPCILDGRCTKYFPKRYVDCTTIDEDGYPIYRRRDNGRKIEKNGIALDNRYVVPHNRYLLLKYGAHMNVEWCNQSRSIKYISPCEADWRIFGFDIHYRDPAVERLNFHLPNEKNIIFLDTDSIDAIMNRNTSFLLDLYGRVQKGSGIQGSVDLQLDEYSLTRPEFVWEQSWRYLSDDILYRQCNMLHHQDLHLTNEEIKNYTFLEIEKILRSSGKSLRDFPMMHFLGTIDVSCCQNRLIQDELRYDRIALAEDHNKFVSNLTKTLSVALRSKGKIVLTVASSGIAFLFLTGGRTAHSRFAIPLAPNEDSTCNIKQVLDRTMRDILRFSNPLSLEQSFGVLKLTKNMRLQSIDSDIDKDELKAFSEWISSSGDGTIGGPNDGHAMIDIPDDLLIKDTEDSAASIVNSTYPSFSENINDPSYLQERAILAPTLDIVESINNYVSSLNRTEENTYLSSDATCRSDSNIDLIGDLHTPEFLNAIKCSGIPNHQLKLKVDVPVMLLRSVDHSLRLCNGTRLVITRLGNHVLEVKSYFRKQC
ncbi:hypothetical protein FEM48_Zijuj01G0027600 [Ziziphus jujuba var. spinosa]|uniref:ATP-dependent DNA helicase n=1 Tax=Ziziphus jujuba var. spinosa TaxID=714518 RepID=A0A978VYP4_ZIZJJ|nr:hypothetical protein FEM48_Zijuj01G0027600 [Ziziphus jujuba var. spinosa]